MSKPAVAPVKLNFFKNVSHYCLRTAVHPTVKKKAGSVCVCAAFKISHQFLRKNRPVRCRSGISLTS